MDTETLGSILFAVVCGIAAAFVMRRFVKPWLESEDKSFIGRTQNVMDETARRQEEKATVFGSRKRTLLVLCVNSALLLGLAFAASQGLLELALYPMCGFVALKVLKVPKDRLMRPNASLDDRLFMRLYQVWSWPLWCWWALRR